MRRNSGEPSPDLCAEYTQDGEPRQPRVANPSAQAMENPAENGGILLALVDKNATLSILVLKLCVNA